MAKQSMSEVAHDLVARSRAGDQNAMAIITLVGQKARKEGPNSLKAKLAYRLIKHEIDGAKPYQFGADPRVPYPPVPFLEGLLDPQSFYQCFARILGYRRGIAAT